MYIYPCHSLEKLRNSCRSVVILIANAFDKAIINMKGDCNCSGGSVCPFLICIRSLISTNEANRYLWDKLQLW